MFKISVVGSINFDVMMGADRLPERGETYTINSVNFHPGGKGLNQAFQSSRLGAYTKFFGCIGDDIFGKFILDRFNDKKNLDMSKICVTDNNTGMGFVNILENGDVYANIHPGANFDVTKQYIDANKDDIFDSDYIILQLEIPVDTVEYIIKIAEEKGIKVVLNAAPAKKIDFKYLNKLHTLIVNETEAMFYSGEHIETIEDALESGEKLQEKIGCNLIITLGEKGSICITDNQKDIIKPEIPKVVKDTTGAGDSYIGAFVFALGSGYNIEEACKFASVVAAKTITKIGAQSAMPSIDEVNDDKGFKI